MKSFLLTIVSVSLLSLQLPVPGQDDSAPPDEETSQSGQGRQVILTLEGGKHAFNIHRLYPDKLVVTKEGGWQFTFKREEILDAENEEVARVLAEARQPLEAVKNQDLATFPDLLLQLDRQRSRVEEFSHIYDWLIPEASRSLRLLNDARHSVEKTLSAVQRTDRILEIIRQSNGEGSPIPANWEGVYDAALKEIDKIPFEKVRQTEISRIQREKELLGEDLSKKNKILLSRLDEAAAEMKEGIAEGSLTRGRRVTLLGQMWRIAKEVPETESRKRAVELVENLEKQTEAIQDLVEGPQAPVEEPRGATETAIKVVSSGNGSVLPGSPTLASTAETTARARIRTSTPVASAALARRASARGVFDVRILGGIVAAILLLSLYFLVRPKGRSASKPAKTSRRVFVPAQNAPTAEKPTPPIQTPEPKVAIATAPSPSGTPPIPFRAETALSPTAAKVPEPESAVSDGREAPPAVMADPEEAPPLTPEDAQQKPDDADLPALSLEEVLESAASSGTADTTEPAEEPFHQVVAEWEEREPTTEPEKAEELEPLPEEPEIEIQTPPISIGIGEITPFDVFVSGGIEMELGEGIVFENTRPAALFPLGDSIGCVSKSGNQTEIHLVQRQASGDLAVCGSPLKHEICISMVYRAEALWVLHEAGISAYVPEETELRKVVDLDAPGTIGDSVGNAASGIPLGRRPLWGSDGTLIASWPGQSVGGYRIRGKSEGIGAESIWSYDEKSPGFSPPASNLAAISNKVCFVSQSGTLHLLDPATGKEQKRAPLPGVWVPERWPISIASSEECVIFAQKESDDRMSLISFPVIAEERSKQATITPCLQPSVFDMGEALLFLSEKEIALFEVGELGRVWSIPLGETQPLDFSCEGSQIAVLVRDEGGRTRVMVLGKNSGAELWSVDPEEIGMTQFSGLVVHEGRLLLWGEGRTEQGILRLVD
jgi:hypothetical protein